MNTDLTYSSSESESNSETKWLNGINFGKLVNGKEKWFKNSGQIHTK